MRRIGVIGDAVCSEKVMNLAEEVGREIAKLKGVLICGGLTGVMEGAARGAKKEGGLTIGIIPSESTDDANPFIDIPIVTGLRDARNIIVVRSSEAIIAPITSFTDVEPSKKKSNGMTSSLGSWTYLLAVARLTVDSCIFSERAIFVRVSGLRNPFDPVSR